ncbi:hypothetical protein, partial [Paraburkholderia kirstenboschensis]|uniref:hypothetical protein n=1 Tax=Paraburkholderia kirstenboschensis TaxID=1245436 RepID=UPI001FB54BE8
MVQENEVAAGMKDRARRPRVTLQHLPDVAGKRCRMLLFYGGSSDVVLTVGSGDPFTAISQQFGGGSVRLFGASIRGGGSRAGRS